MQIRLLTRAVLLLVCSLAWGDDLITAVKAGDANAVESMIKQGVDVDAPEANGTRLCTGRYTNRMRRW